MVSNSDRAESGTPDLDRFMKTWVRPSHAQMKSMHNDPAPERETIQPEDIHRVPGPAPLGVETLGAMHRLTTTLKHAACM